MQLAMFSIYDDKAKAYISPFFLPSVAVAIRAFGDAVNDPATAFYKHPADYTLFCIGSFDDATGKVEREQPFITCATGLELRQTQLVMDARQRDFVADVPPAGRFESDAEREARLDALARRANSGDPEHAQ